MTTNLEELLEEATKKHQQAVATVNYMSGVVDTLRDLIARRDAPDPQEKPDK